MLRFFTILGMRFSGALERVSNWQLEENSDDWQLEESTDVWLLE